MSANTLLAAIICRLVIAGNINDTNEKIQQLEKDKNDLYKQINEAIDESIKSLHKSNDTDALVGLKYMTDLKKRLKEDNETLDLDNRRKFDKLRKKKHKSDMFDFESVLKPKKMSPSEWKELMDDRDKMQKQLNEWILKREKEKARLEQYRLYKKGMIISGKYEKCPRFGYQGKKKRGVRQRRKIKHCKEKISESDFDEDYKKCVGLTKNQTKTTSRFDINDSRMKRKSRKKKYPCCRKCCKKSYMGCL